MSQNGHNFNCILHVHAEFGFEIGFVLLGNSSMTLLYTRDKGALLWQQIFGLKLLLMHKRISVRDNENVITYITGFSWSANPMKTFLIAGVKGCCHGNQFWPK